MFLTVHATLGTIIGEYTGNIGLAFAAGFVSHFILDMIPHGDQDLMTREKSNLAKQDLVLTAKIASADGLVMIIFLAILYWQHIIPLTLPVLAGIIGSIAPDFINGFYLLTKHPWLKKYSYYHFALHDFIKIRLSITTGFICQLLIVILLTIALIIF
ncbi:MAG: hypothetical protein WC675_03205 [Patescibacteria group bacterium]|jgi:hypothetical protein